MRSTSVGMKSTTCLGRMLELAPGPHEAARCLAVAGYRRVTSHLDGAGRARPLGVVPCARRAPTAAHPPTLIDVDQCLPALSRGRRNRLLERAAIGRRAHGCPLEIVEGVATIEELCVEAMSRITRRQFMSRAAALGATLAYGCARPRLQPWREQRNHFPQGVASGDPDAESVILWTRRPPVAGSTAHRLAVEVARDRDFTDVVATAEAAIAAESDWTCRILAAGLEPAREYWYRFTDEHGSGSRVGRTVTAPADSDDRPVRFAFVSCQSVTEGAFNAYRRMIHEDERRPRAEQLSFVLHLGDYIYEVIWYPEDKPEGRYARKLREVYRMPNGEKIGDLHVPTTLEDYRTTYRAYLEDPDLQDARARWPFVCVWDNHEFSWQGFQSQQVFNGKVRPAQKFG